MTEMPAFEAVPVEELPVRELPAGVANGLRTAWEVVRDNIPVVNALVDQAHAVPAGSNWGADLTQGGGPNYLTFWFRAYHPNGMPGAAVRMRLYWVFGARYRGGGAFIPNAWLDVLDCDVAAGNTVNIDVTVHDPRNWGTETAPNAYLPISIRCQDSTEVATIVETRVFGLYGTGHYEEYSG
jgi:hypothetical protein